MCDEAEMHAFSCYISGMLCLVIFFLPAGLCQREAAKGLN